MKLGKALDVDIDDQDDSEAKRKKKKKKQKKEEDESEEEEVEYNLPPCTLDIHFKHNTPTVLNSPTPLHNQT